MREMSDGGMKRLAVLALASLFALPLVVAACSDDAGPGDAEPFDTLADCFDDHHNEESLPTADAISVCCLDHPIAGKKESCGTNSAECQTHVKAELTGVDGVTDADIKAACDDYESQL